ncbi:MAG TPA: sigma-54 dependent transcriptional regulator [Methylomirabilota bacterium]|nr:sigma-54 dependent transcriptional regulator [Methylomirabilota bacterium]
MSAASDRSAAQPPGRFSCLIVEDDPAFAALVAEVVRREGGEPTHCKTLAEAGAATLGTAFDLVLLDNHLPDGKAYDFFGQFSRRNPDAPIVMITGLPDLAEAIALTRNGLFDYLTKPVDENLLADCLGRARLRLQHQRHNDASAECIGPSSAMREVMHQLRQAARHPAATVLLTGESGVGKDAAARALHRLTFGERAATVPYVALNCAAVPGDMFEAELFGAERGAYTGADRRRTGLVAAAQGGTLFLDEIAEVPLASQAKLLRFLEGREFRPLGATAHETFTGRFVTATNKSLRAEVQAGRFREDLLFRIEVFTVHIPPLRQRREDIPPLAEHLLAHLASRYGRRPPLLRATDLAALAAHDFPGNVRELRNLLERALLRTPEDGRWLAFDASWLKGLEPHSRSSLLSPASPTTTAPTDEPLPAMRTGLPPLEAQEYRMIRATLRECHGGIRRAAAKLGLSPQALLRRLEKWPELREATSASD